jgi:hypothetical protein
VGLQQSKVIDICINMGQSVDVVMARQSLYTGRKFSTAARLLACQRLLFRLTDIAVAHYNWFYVYIIQTS